MSSNPHDALFKAVFGQPEHARGLLRAALPESLSAALDWSTLARCPGSFVDSALRERHTDLLFSAAVPGGGETLVYLLFEHQSTSDPQMAYRLLRYMVRVWDRWEREHAGALTLPAILPVVLYHGAGPWSAPRSFDALLDLPDALRQAASTHVPHFSYLVDDLSQIPEDVLRRRAMTALAFLAAACFKYARSEADLLQRLSQWADSLRAVAAAPHGLEALAQLVRYTLLVSEHVTSEELQALLEREVGPETKDAVMTAGQRLIEQGVQRGKLEGERALLLRLVRHRFGAAVDQATEHRIAEASEEQLDTWAERVLSAPTLAELLDDPNS